MNEKTAVRTEKAPAPFQGAPYSQAIKTEGLVFVSGQVSLRPDHGEIVGSTIQEQTEQIMKNLGTILDEAGSGLDRLVKTTVFLTNLDDFQGMNEVYARHVGETPPARATIEVGRLPAGALVEIDADRDRLSQSRAQPSPATSQSTASRAIFAGTSWPPLNSR